MAKKLFQHVVTEPEIKGAAAKMTQETLKVFKTSSLFDGHSKEYQPKHADGDPLPRDEKQVVTTVAQRLAWTRKSIANLFDYELARDSANQQASANLIVDGKVLAEKVPASFLLTLEKQLREVRNYYDAIPTLDLATPWQVATGQADIYISGPIETYRTSKKTTPVVLYAATKEHPAQVKEVVEDIVIGSFKTTSMSGKIHPKEKAEYLGRIDKLIEAVLDARMRANEAAVPEVKIGDAIFNFIHAPSAPNK